MVIESIDVRNFQSLHHVHLELGQFNVIVGPSSSGKSALTRALRTLIANRRGADFISHGERITTISARTTQGTITLTRGKSTNDNSYVIVPANPDHKLAPKQTWTKLGGDVPPEVSEFIGIDPKDPIAFASQFDKPYLLDEKPPEVARVLGGLTNVDVIFAASRESNRRKLATTATLRTRNEDLAAIKEKIPGYRAIRTQDAALTEAETLISEARKLQDEINSLEAAIDALEISQSRTEALKPSLGIVVPDEQPLIDAHQDLARFRDAVKEDMAAQSELEAATERRFRAESEVSELEEAYSKALKGLARGFYDYMWENGSHHNALISVDQAADLAAKYVATFID